MKTNFTFLDCVFLHLFNFQLSNLKWQNQPCVNHSSSLFIIVAFFLLIFWRIYLVLCEEDVSRLFQGRVGTAEGSGTADIFSDSMNSSDTGGGLCQTGWFIQTGLFLLFVQVARLWTSVDWGTCSPCGFTPACSPLCPHFTACSCFTRVWISIILPLWQNMNVSDSVSVC